jgi:uncharacterized protein with GYD domain
MPTYVILINYTQQGVEDMKGSPARLDAARQAFQAVGAELKAFYLTMGQYDAVAIAEGPDDETAIWLAMAIGAQGAIRTQTLRAFTEDEYREIVASLPR